jgi:putative flippase GtrA
MNPTRRLSELFQRYREVLLYCFFGFCTFLVSMATFALCNRALGMDALIANIISWIFAVLFAFFTNRKWVFDGDANTAKGLWGQMLSFFGGRLFTLAVEEGILALFVTLLGFDELIVKLVAQVVVIVLNYFISKFWVFRKKQ